MTTYKVSKSAAECHEELLREAEREHALLQTCPVLTVRWERAETGSELVLLNLTGAPATIQTVKLAFKGTPPDADASTLNDEPFGAHERRTLCRWTSACDPRASVTANLSYGPVHYFNGVRFGDGRWYVGLAHGPPGMAYQQLTIRPPC